MWIEICKFFTWKRSAYKNKQTLFMSPATFFPNHLGESENLPDVLGYVCKMSNAQFSISYHGS